MDFKLWKLIGHQFMVKSNINHWIVCTEGEGSLVEYKKGSLNCRVVKIIAAACQNVAPDEIRLLTKEAAGNYGPHLWNTKSPTWLKTYYYWESSTQSGNWPTHDPCGQNGLSHVKNVQNPHGNIYIRWDSVDQLKHWRNGLGWGFFFCGKVNSCRSDSHERNKAYYKREFWQEHRFKLNRKFSFTCLSEVDSHLQLQMWPFHNLKSHR